MLFLISLIILILSHELAHLIIAKKCGCGVEIFSLGFGSPIFKKKMGETTYQMAPILLGGFCQLTDEVVVSKNPAAFTNLSYSKKVAIALAGVIINIIMGLIALYVGKLIANFQLYYFGYLSLVLGITNAIPFPALDGSYPILVWLEKFYGKEKGYKLMSRICRIGFIIIMTLNVLFLPLLIYYIKTGVL